MIWVLLALAGPPDAELALEEGRVAEAAAAVARARRDGVRASRIAELMAVYRAEAERLAAMRPVADPARETTERDAALRALNEATARGEEDAEARAIVERWLGALAARVDVLEGALAVAATSPPELAGPMELDVERQAVAVMLTAAYDASREDAVARAARTRAASLRAGSNPLERAGLAVEVELRTLAEEADGATLRAEQLRALVARAMGVRDAARLARGEP